MQITISGKQLNLSDALREHVELHMKEMSAKYFDHALEAQVTFGRTRAFFTCDIHIHPGKSLEMHGTGEGATAQAAFDAAAAHAAKQLRRYRRRASEHGAAVKVSEQS
jgi:ribosomal subunit interface protein